MVTEKENDLQQRVSTGKRRYLVFTSAGDRTNLRMWLAEDRRFDLWITSYGDHPDTLEGLWRLLGMPEGLKVSEPTGCLSTVAG